ncbi:hypothetical protein RB598_000049 [Gaeumannomyces tritici]
MTLAKHGAAAQPKDQLDPQEIVRQHVSFVPSGPGWQGMPELPTPAEINRSWNDVEALPTDRVDEPWEQKDEYLATKYKILRCEGTESLRHAVSTYKLDPFMFDDKTTCVYTNVYIIGYLMTRIGAFFRVRFSTRRAGVKIKWLQSRRFTPGTILAISTAEDKFQTICKIAVVAQRPYKDGLDQNPPLVDLLWADPNEAVFDPGLELVIVESRTGYYEAARHALTGLQHVANEPTTLDKYIVCGQRKVETPASVRASPVMDLSPIVHAPPQGDPEENHAIALHNAKAPFREVDILGKVPGGLTSVTSMDHSQIMALKDMLTKEIAIVQGPPGTGKTFTSVSTLDVLRENRDRVHDPPIIVAAQTNHALDQILMHCDGAGASILRVGGRTENEKMQERTVFCLRKMMAGNQAQRRFRALDQVRRREIDRLSEKLVGAFPEGLLKPALLKEYGLLTQAHLDSLSDSDWEGLPGSGAPDADTGDTDQEASLELWLGDQRTTGLAAQAEPEFEMEETIGEVNREYEVDVGLDRTADEDEDGRIHGTWIVLDYKQTGKLPPKARRTGKNKTPEDWLASTDDLWDIPSHFRGAVYRHLQAGLMKAIRPVLVDCLAGYKKSCQEMKIGKWTNDLQLIKAHKIEIVGCTTTGLTKYRGFLAAMRPRIMLIEEAAETREPNIVSALYKSLQQLILVGDHQQLTPHCDIQALSGAPFFLNVSLFERMVKLGIPFSRLTQQRRMKPEIRQLLDHFYEGLSDHPLVASRPDVPGMGGRNMWLFHHQWPEEMDADCSKYNRQEAEMAVKFFAYLVNNGTDPGLITILTFYNGQRKVLLRMLRNEPALRGMSSFNVFTVDSYQGEENDVVILSLVRSPKPDAQYLVGFLEDRNRATVAISRARCGFYIFGNFINLLRANEESFYVWGNVHSCFAVNGYLDTARGLPIVCQQHGSETWIKGLDDFVGNAGGCRRMCTGHLPCGHKCRLACHWRRHDSYACSEPCTKKLPSCGHPCSNRCTEKCFCKQCEFEQSAASHQAMLVERALHPSLEDVLDHKDLGANDAIPVAGSLLGRGRGGGAGRAAGVGRGGMRGGNARGGGQCAMVPSSVASWAAYSQDTSKFDERDRLQASAARAALPPRERIDIKEKFKEARIVNGQRTKAAKKVEVLLPGLDGSTEESAQAASGSNRPASLVELSEAAKGTGRDSRPNKAVSGQAGATRALFRPGHFVGSEALPATTRAVPATAGAVPAATEALPATTRAVPAATGALPGTAGALPATTKALPEEDEDLISLV